MTAAPDSALVSDAELAVAAASGDRAAFAGIYDRYANRLYDFCVGMVRDGNTAADCVQDTFCTAATRLASLRDPDKLRPWLYAIARNEALRCIRERRREQPSDELPEASSSEPSPDTLAARSELAELVAQAAGGLSDRDRTVLELTYRHGLDGPELAEALGVSAASARTLTHRLRETVERSLGALLVVRSARAGHGCPELAASVKDWDGQFTVLTRKRVARHIDSCLTCEASRRKLVNREALLGAAPLFIPAPSGLRTRTLDRIQLVCAETALTGPSSADAAAGPAGKEAGAPGAALVGSATTSTPAGPLAETALAGADAGGDGFGDDEQRRRRRGLLLLFLLLAVALFAALWLALSWPFANDAPTAPAGVTATSSQPRPTPTASSTTQAPASTPLPPPPVTSPSAPPSSPPVYRQPTTQQFVPPAADPTPSDVPAPPMPRLRPTPTPPMVAVPSVPHPTPSGTMHSKSGTSGSGTSGSGTSGSGTSGSGTSGSGTTGSGTPGTSGGTSGPSGSTGGTSGSTGGTSGSTGPVR